MDAGQRFLTYRHPVEGSMSWTKEGDVVRFSCRWPFDLSTDEWIEVSNELDHATYVRELDTLRKVGHCLIKGKRSGCMEFTVISSDRIRLGLFDQETVRPTSLQLTLAVTVGDLIPGKEARQRMHK